MTSFLNNPIWQQRIFEQIESNVAHTPCEANTPSAAVAIHIDLKQLLIHTAGLPDYAHPSQPWSLAAFLRLAQANSMRFIPGSG